MADYMGLVFENGTAISILVWPTLTLQGVVLSPESNQYREALSGLVGLPVQDAQNTEDFINIDFEGDVSARIPLDTDTPSGEHIIINATGYCMIVG